VGGPLTRLRQAPSLGCSQRTALSADGVKGACHAQKGFLLLIRGEKQEAMNDAKSFGSER
jgi:hypothetical protein